MQQFTILGKYRKMIECLDFPLKQADKNNYKKGDKLQVWDQARRCLSSNTLMYGEQTHIHKHIHATETLRKL